MVKEKKHLDTGVEVRRVDSTVKPVIIGDEKHEHKIWSLIKYGFLIVSMKPLTL